MLVLAIKRLRRGVGFVAGNLLCACVSAVLQFFEVAAARPRRGFLRYFRHHRHHHRRRHHNARGDADTQFYCPAPAGREPIGRNI